MNFPYWAIAVIAAGSAYVGYLLRGPVRTFLLRVQGTRRYQVRLDSLGAKAARDERAEASPQIITSDLSAELDTSAISHLPCYFFVADLKVDNLRCFEQTRLDFRFPGERNDLLFPNVNLLLGDNGTGKSTILRAIAIAALAPVLKTGFAPYKLVRDGAEIADIAGTFVFRGAGGRPLSLPGKASIARRGDIQEIQPVTDGS